MPLQEIDPATPAAARPSVKVNGRTICSPEKLKSALIDHPALGLSVEVGGHPSNRFAPIAIRTSGIQHYAIYFALNHGILIAAMRESERSPDGEKFWGLEKMKLDISDVSSVIPPVQTAVKITDEDILETDLKIKVVDTPDVPINLNRELFITDKDSGIRFRMIRIFNMPLNSNTHNYQAEHFKGKFDPGEKLFDKMEANQEYFLIDNETFFFNARQAKKQGDGITKLGIGILEDLLGI